MRKPWLALLLALIVPVTAIAQTQPDDPLVGVFKNAASNLSLSVNKTGDGVYEGFLNYQGQRYPFQGVKLLGMLSAEYTYQGNQVAFSLARLVGVYYLTSEGVTLEMERSSAKADTGTPAAAGQPQKTAPASTPAGAAASTQAPVATGARVSDPYGGLSFQVPAGWQQTQQGSSFVFTRAGTQIQLGIAPHNYNALDEIRANAFDVQDQESNTYLQARVQPYGSNGLLVRYEGTTQGQAVVIETIALVSPHGGGVNVAGSGLKAQYTAEYTAALKTIANSMQFAKPQVSPAAQQWKQRLAGKQLLYLYTGNGLSDKITIDLCAGGQFLYYSNSSYTSGGYADFSYAGRENDRGTWKIISRGAETVLMLYYNNGSVGEYAITARQAGNEVGLSGKRYFVQATQQCP